MRYVIYARKSTEEDDRQVLSIEAQLTELKEFAAKEKLEIVASFHEAKTAKEPGRIVFGEMVSFLEKGKADGIICWHPDRLARNSVDGGKIIHLVDRGIIKALKFPTFWFEATPQGLFMLQIAFGQSKYYVDNLRENVKRGLRQKIRNGVWPSKAPVGYLNNPKTRGIDIDPIKASKIREFFEQYASGQHTQISLLQWCNDNNLLSRSNKYIQLSKISEMLKNVFYLGLMKYGGEIYEGKHEPIIPKKLFDRVQEILQEKGKPHKDKKHHFNFLGLMKCPCGAAITAEYKRKKSGKEYVYYRCTRKKGKCEELFLRDIFLEQQIKEYLQKISLSDKELEKAFLDLEAEYRKDTSKQEANILKLKNELAKIEAILEKLLNAFLAGVLSTEEYTSQKQKILIKKLELKEKIRDIEERGITWLGLSKDFVLSLNRANKLLETNNQTEMTPFLKNIGSHHLLQNRQLVFSWQPPYNLAAESGRPFVISRIVVLKSEISKNFDGIVREIEKWTEILRSS